MVNRVRQNAHTGLVGLTFFTLFASDAWRNLIGWWGYLALGLALLITWLIIVLRARRSLYWRALPASFAIFLAWAGLSITWSHDTGTSAWGWASTVAIAFVAYAIVLTTDRAELVRGLGFALRWILALSLIFEAAVSLFVRHPVVPLWVNGGDTKIPASFYWSQGSLLTLGPVQGIVGDRNLLGFISLLALIIFCVQLADRAVWRGSGIMWIVIAVATFALTRSSTAVIAFVFVALAGAAALWTRVRPTSRRWPVYLTVAGGVLAALATAPLWVSPVVALFAPRADVAGRVEMGSAAWPQVGIIGLVVLIVVVFMGLWRAWFLAVDRPRWDLDDRRPFTAHALMPLLLLVALLAQGVTESRLLDGSLALFAAVIIAVKMPARGLGERR